MPTAALVLNVVLPVLLAAAVNAVIYMRGWSSPTNGHNRLQRTTALPPGWAIAIIWSFILALLGYVHYRTFPSIASFVVLATIVFCLMYPFLTRLRAENSRVLNVTTLVIAGIVLSLTAARGDRRAVLAVAPLFAWASYVNIAEASE